MYHMQVMYHKFQNLKHKHYDQIQGLKSSSIQDIVIKNKQP